MIYLLDNWVKKPENESRIVELIEQLHSDLKFPDDLTETDIADELEAMGEDILAEKVRNKEL